MQCALFHCAESELRFADFWAKYCGFFSCKIKTVYKCKKNELYIIYFLVTLQWDMIFHAKVLRSNKNLKCNPCTFPIIGFCWLTSTVCGTFGRFWCWKLKFKFLDNVGMLQRKKKLSFDSWRFELLYENFPISLSCLQCL